MITARLKSAVALCGALAWAGLAEAQAGPVQASPAETPGTTPEQAPPQQATPQAQPSAPEQQAPEDDKLDRELEAKQHFQLGSTFYDSGRFREAAEEFDEAYRLSGRPQLLYNLYVAYRDDGRLAESVEALSAYLKAVPDAPDRINLRARLESMQAQLAARRKREAEAQRAGEAPAVMAEPADDVPPARSVVPWVLMGAGSALVVASIGTGLAAKSGSDELAEACNDDRQCPASEQDAIDRTRRLAITTDALWAGGAAVAVTGLVLWLTGALDRERRPAAQMAVGADARSLRLSVAGRF